MTATQHESFLEFILDDAKSESIRFHQGCCVGSDEAATQAIREAFGHRAWIIGHRPDISTMVSEYCVTNSNEVREPLPYLVRNGNIVTECQLLVATLQEMDEVIRSGTWSTIRAAKKYGRGYVIIYPDGSVVEKRVR